MSQTKGSQDDEGLLWGIKNGDLEAVKNIVEKDKAKVTVALKGRSPLHHAADYGQQEIINFLLENGANVNAEDSHGITPLLAAVFEGHTECTKLLIKKGANKSGKAPDGQSYIESAEKQEIKDLLK